MTIIGDWIFRHPVCLPACTHLWGEKRQTNKQKNEWSRTLTLQGSVCGRFIHPSITVTEHVSVVQPFF